MVRFLPEEPVVLDPSWGLSEGSRCCPREPIREEPRPQAVRQKRGDDDRGKVGAGTGGAVAPAFVVELARYSATAGDRVLYGQWLTVW